MSNDIKSKKEEIKIAIEKLVAKQMILSQGNSITPDQLKEPFKTASNKWDHYETKRILLGTQLMILQEIEKTDKITKRALNVAWISLGASLISITATIISYIWDTYL